LNCSLQEPDEWFMRVLKTHSVFKTRINHF
jgi:hypothetical protein